MKQPQPAPEPVLDRLGQIIAAAPRVFAVGLGEDCSLLIGDLALHGAESDMIETVDKCKRFPSSPETGPQFEFVRSFKRRALPAP